LRKNYLPKCYEETSSKIWVLCGKKCVNVHRWNNRCKWKEG
jgi:hypothetical protein